MKKEKKSSAKLKVVNDSLQNKATKDHSKSLKNDMSSLNAQNNLNAASNNLTSNFIVSNGQQQNNGNNSLLAINPPLNSINSQINNNNLPSSLVNTNSVSLNYLPLTVATSNQQQQQLNPNVSSAQLNSLQPSNTLSSISTANLGGLQQQQQQISNYNPPFQSGANINNNNGVVALTTNTTASSSNNGTMSGYLQKWTNYIKGYQKRWFVLNNGLLSYYRSQAEMAHTCRGTINVVNAIISSEDSCHFVVSNSNLGLQTFHLKASNELEKQKWVSALELAKNRAKQYSHDSEDEEINTEQEKNEVQTMLKTLQQKLEDLSTCNELVQKHSNALTKSLIDLEGLQSKPDESTLKTINERATLYKITMLAMINTCQEFSQLANQQGRKMQKILLSERELRAKLEDMVQEMAKTQSNIETQMSRRSKRKDGTTNSQDTNNKINQQSQGGGQSQNSNSSGAGANDCNQQQQTKKTNRHNSKSGQNYAGSSDIGEGSSHMVTKKALFDLNDDDDDGGEIMSNANDDEFHDAVEDVTVFPITLPKPPKLQHKRNTSNLSKLSLEESDVSTEDEDQNQTTINVTMHTNKDTNQQGVNKVETSAQQQQKQQQQIVLKTKERRTEIPQRPNYSINLWGIMKNCIGKDLSKIPIPVNFSEPLSMLQRIIEEMEYSELLDKAASCTDQWEQMAYVAAFTISAYSTTATRTNKPFNPILGETYECDRFDETAFGWRALAEQVSHHPPGLAVNVESVRDWQLYQEFTMSSKFRGQYLQIVPLGTSHLEFKKTGHHYTWRKITTFVRNIIVGKLWIDNVGEMDIINHKTKDVCHLKYFAYSYFSREPPRKVTGIITDSNNVARYVLNGTWTEQIEGAPVLNPQVVTEQTQLNTGASKVLWRRKYPPAHLENMYNFTELAVQLNEPEEGVAPTDTRNRPDQRLMEQGAWDEANKEKLRLEEKQRTIRKQREQLNEIAVHENKPPIEHDPLWFKKTTDPYTNLPIHIFKNEYWDCKQKKDWKRCPDLF